MNLTVGISTVTFNFFRAGELSEAPQEVPMLISTLNTRRSVKKKKPVKGFFLHRSFPARAEETNIDTSICTHFYGSTSI